MKITKIVHDQQRGRFKVHLVDPAAIVEVSAEAVLNWRRLERHILAAVGRIPDDLRHLSRCPRRLADELWRAELDALLEPAADGNRPEIGV